MNKSDLSIKRVFTAVNGKELVDMILLDLKAKLLQDMDFEEAVTFPVVEYDCTLAIRAYPWRTEKWVDKSKSGRIGDEPAEHLGEPITAEVTAQEIIDKENPPDRARESRDMPVMIPGKSPTGGKYYVDRPQRKSERISRDRHHVGEDD